METYQFIILVALLLGIVGIIAMMERRRRSDLAQYEQLHQSLSLCIGSLQAIHSSNESQTAQVVEAFEKLHQTLSSCLDSLQTIHSSSDTQVGQVVNALSVLQLAVEKGIIASSDSTAKLTGATELAFKQASSRLEIAVQQHQNAVDTTINQTADKISDFTAAKSNELLVEIQNTTKAIKELQGSLEASVKF